MKGFSLTRKRLLAQPEKRRHRLVSDWFKELYIASQEEIPASEEKTFLLGQYRNLLEWLSMESSSIFEEEVLSWREFLADRYHLHYQLSGKGLAEHSLLPEIITGDKQENTPWSSSLSWQVALNNIRSAFNVGSILRTTDGAGWEQVILGGTTPTGDHQQVVKTSMSTCNWIPWQHAENLSDQLLLKKQEGYAVIGLETVEGAIDYNEFEWPEQGILVLGNEEYGISTSVLSVCDSFVKIPMQGRKNSINVANAYAVIAFYLAGVKHASV